MPPSMVKSAHSLSASGLMISQPGHGASSASQVQRTKRPLTPSCVLPAQAAKRPRNLAYPSAQLQTLKQIRKPIGTSKQAIAKHRANEQVHNGTFTHNPKRWEAYKRKLAELDPNFEVSDDPRLVHQVKHSTCGGCISKRSYDLTCLNCLNFNFKAPKGVKAKYSLKCALDIYF
jgi:hypothetical protein